MITFCGNKQIRTLCPLQLMNKHPKVHSTLGTGKEDRIIYFSLFPYTVFPGSLLLKTFDCRVGRIFQSEICFFGLY